jgi:hypothetical protein
MKACRAFSLIAGSRTAWVPCVRKAEKGEKYCQRHGEAVAGVLLGELMYEEGSQGEIRTSVGVYAKSKDVAID